MKKALIIVLCAVAFTALTGCSLIFGTPDFVSKTEIVTESPDNVSPGTEWDVIMTAENVTASGLTLKAQNTNPAAEVITGAEFWLDIYTEDGWQEARRITHEDIYWDALAYLFENGNAEWEIGWEHIYGTLESGKYRIGKKFFVDSNDIKYCYAQFEII